MENEKYIICICIKHRINVLQSCHILIQQLDISYKEQIQMRAKAVYITLGANNKNSS